MGSDFYETAEEKKENERKKIPNLGIGRNCKINKAIIDKNAHIGNNCCINVNGKTYEDGDHGLFYSSDGIIVIRKGAVIPDGTVI
jgi:glucose-1-phosphate adenylyltransferase